MQSRFLKIIAVNTLVTFFLTFISLEIFFRFKNSNYGTAWHSNSNHYENILKAKEVANQNKEFTLVIGDSFAAFNKGTDNNMFDLVYKCKNYANCNYYNLAIPGTNTETYWKTINYVLNERKSNSKTNIIFAFYYGNDFHLSDDSRRKCEKVYNAELVVNKTNYFSRIKKSSFFLNIFYRFLKEKFSFGKNDKSKLIDRAVFFRSSIKEWQLKYPDYSKTLSNIPENILNKVKNDVLNPNEVSLALANPFYYQELYSMSKKWSYDAVNCTLINIKSNYRYLSEKIPSIKFTLIGIPDKHFWNTTTTEKTLDEYRELGYIFDDEKIIDYISIQNKIKDLGKSLGFKVIHLPDLFEIKSNDFSNYFYKYDMHLNSYGNVQLSKKLLEYLKSNNH